MAINMIVSSCMTKWHTTDSMALKMNKGKWSYENTSFTNNKEYMIDYKNTVLQIRTGQPAMAGKNFGDSAFGR